MKSLYRRYRPMTLREVVGQPQVTEPLAKSLEQGKISHAYLFIGPRGTGKTSVARIFAHEINGFKYELEDDYVDIIEIDGASNRGIDNIRELREKAAIAPTSGKYKVYIIDEVHMLTNSAFNALLKTLEEPPSYVVFILATTEFYEVPETIVSRCQCYSFGRISLKSLEDRLKYIAKQEKIDITDEAVTEIAQYSNGGLRDAISMLDKIRSFTDEKITVDIFKNINGMVSQQEINSFYEAIFNKDVSQILDIINRINETGYDFKNFVERVMILTRDNIVKYYTNKKEIIGSINKNVELVTILNDILNRLKDAINPVVIVQVFILKFIEESNESVEKTEDKSIAREIILPEKETEKASKTKKSVKEEQKSEVKEEPPIEEKKEVKESKKSEITVNEEIKKIRINNTMATANMDYKKELTKIWKDLDKYFMDNKFGKVAQLLSDTTPMVVGTDNILLTAPTDGVISNIYSNLIQIEEFIKEIYRLMKVVVVSDNEFLSVKNKYIEDKANKITYEVMEEYDKLVNENNDLINQAIDLFGSDLVDIE